MKRTVVTAALLLGAASLACDGPAGLRSTQPETFTATLSGSAARPAVTTDATGSATVHWDPASRLFTYTLATSNITGVGTAHIHGPATAEQTAEILVTLRAPTTMGITRTFSAADIIIWGTRLYGATPAARVDSLIALMGSGQAYVDVHTIVNRDSHIRGQLTRQ